MYKKVKDGPWGSWNSNVLGEINGTMRLQAYRIWWGIPVGLGLQLTEPRRTQISSPMQTQKIYSLRQPSLIGPDIKWDGECVMGFWSSLIHHLFLFPFLKPTMNLWYCYSLCILVLTKQWNDNCILYFLYFIIPIFSDSILWTKWAIRNEIDKE